MGWLILAAGQSTRFNGDKLCAQLPNGRSLLRTSLHPYLAHKAPLLVITRPNHIELHDQLDELNVSYGVCDSAHLGMGYSIAWGVAQIKRVWPWVGIALADMPGVASSTVNQLASLAIASKIIVPVCRDDARPFGHPVVFGADFFDELTMLRGDTGARDIMIRHAASVVECQMHDSGIYQDIDTQQDLLSYHSL